MPPKKRADEDENEFEGGADSGAANCSMVKASGIKKGDYMIIKGNPCKCVSTSTSKTGKHGGAKCHIVGLDIFTNKKHECIVGSTCDVDAPIVQKRDLMVTNYDETDKQMSGLNDNSEEETFKVTNEDTLKLIADCDFDNNTYIITVMEAIGFQDVINIKEDKQ